MGWVVKKPKRYDFCGCPPCPLCFVWQEPAPPAKTEEPKAVAKAKPKVVDGMVKLALDLLGREPTSDSEVSQLKDIAETIHEKGVAGLTPKKPPPSLAGSVKVVEETVVEIDIGLSSLDRANTFFRNLPKKKRDIKPAQPNCDEVYERAAAREEEQKAIKEAARKEKQRMKEMVKLLQGE
jgi:hypothetical protein